MLPTGHRIGGVITDEDGRPISGASVQASVLIREQAQTCISTWLTGTKSLPITDRDGRWFIENAPGPIVDSTTDYAFRLLVSHPDFLSDTNWRTIRNGIARNVEQLRDETLEVQLEKGYRVHGTVKNSQGKLVDDGIVVWGSQPYSTEGSQEIRLSSEGSFETPPMPLGDLLLTVVASGSSPTTLELFIDDDESVNLQLDEPNELKFQVVDIGGVPIPSAKVSIRSWRNASSLYNHKHPSVLDSKVPTGCDEQGFYRWNWAPMDPVTIEVYATGYHSVVTTVAPDFNDLVITLNDE
jgi:hypothetical protein